MKLFLSIFILNFYFVIFHFSSSNARIFSSYSQYTPILLSNLKEPGNKFQRFFNRVKRQASLSKQLPSIDSAEFKLGNETSHNQALIHWSGNYSDVIFILTRQKDSSVPSQVTHSMLWRSDNYGKTYVDQSDKFDKHVSLRSYYTCPNNKSKVLFIDSFRNPPILSRVWASEDEGVTYSVTNINFTLDKILFHPDKQDVVLGYDKAESTLYASMDFGKHWDKLQEGVTIDRYFWYKKGLDDDDIVFMEYQDHSAFVRPFFFVKACRVPHCTNTNIDPIFSLLGPIEEKSLLVQDDYIFVQDIHVVSSHSNTVVVGVNHDDGVTNLYFSDEKGHEYALSLEDVRYFNKKTGYDQVFTVDMHEVKGVKGAFLANKRVLGFLNRTMITWDNGRVWNYLAIPETDGAQCEGCYLNLHCAMSNTKSGYFMPSMLTKESAPGLIIAHGSVAKSLADSPTLVSVYVSNDTGRTWRPAMRGRNLFVMADHGSIIVAVSMHFLRAVVNLSLSNDFGVSWKKFIFSSHRIYVDGILTEPGESTHMFTLFGHNSQRGPWKVFSIDVSDVINRNCSHPADFRNVTLPFADAQHCHLGMNRQIEVALPGCLLGRTYRRPSLTKVCNCTDNDYECGFEYSAGPKGTCKKLFPQIDWISDVISDGQFYESDPPCVNGFRNVSMYRKIPGDVCVNELSNKLSSPTPCKNLSPPPSVPFFSTTSTTTTTQTPFSTSTLGLKLVVVWGGRYGVVKTRKIVKASEAVQWKVAYLNSTEVSPHFTTPNNTMIIQPLIAGSYLVSATSKQNRTKTSHVVLEFYHQIANLSILHPPVIAVSSPFEVNAFVSALNALPGIPSLTGPVKYQWTVNGRMMKKGDWGDRSFSGESPRRPGQMALHVMASNKVNQISTYTYVSVTDYVAVVKIPLVPSFPVNSSLLQFDWLRDVCRSLRVELYKLLHKHVPSYDLNFHTYIAPELPLEASLIFSPIPTSTETLEQLTSVANDMKKYIEESGLVLKLTHDHLILVPPQPKKGSSAVVITLVILLVVVLVVVLVLIARRYGRLRRWRSYFIRRGFSSAFRSSPSVHTYHRHDREPIVDDNDEHYFDEELEDFDPPDAPKDGALRFQS